MNRNLIYEKNSITIITVFFKKLGLFTLFMMIAFYFFMVFRLFHY
ncbi:hypothetical protein [Flavobacterium sp. 3HN19-14]